MSATFSLPPDQMDRKMDEHFSFEAHDDVEGVLATLAPNALHDIVGWPGGPTRDKSSIRNFYETLFADLSDGQVTSLRRLHGERFLVDESLWRGKATGRPFGIEGRNRPLEFRLLHIVDFSESGKIEKEQVWIDLAAIIQQLPSAQNPPAN